MLKIKGLILFYVFLILLIGTILSSCIADKSKKNNFKYLFLGHAYQYGNKEGNKVDDRIAAIDKTVFDQIWLGGDVCSSTNVDNGTLIYLDSIFNLKSPYTYWAYGNHDIMYVNNNNIENATGKKSYFSNYNNGFTVIQINTNLDNLYLKYADPDLCKKRDEQYNLIKKVCDTITGKSSNLIFIMHHVLWYDIDSNCANYANLIHKKWMAKCDSSATFLNTIYPLLKEVQKRNIQVICIAGDVGIFGKQGYFKDAEGIIYLASGINNSSIWDEQKRKEAPKDRVLILNHDLLLKKITWTFADLDSLLLSQKK